jgi:hypothetical protein
LLALLRRHVFGSCLNGKQLADQANEFAHRMIATALYLREVLFGLNQVTSRVRPASEVHQLVCSGDFVVRLVAVAHQYRAGFDASIEHGGLRRAARGTVAEHSHWWSGTVHLRPHVALALCSTAWLF